MRLRTVSAEADPAAFEALRTDARLAAAAQHPFTGSFGRHYYPLVLEDRRREASFVVADGDAPLAIVACTTGEGALDWYGMPARVFGDGDRLGVGVISAVFAEIERLLERDGASRASLLEPIAGGSLSPLGLAATGRGWRGELAFNGRVDLEGGETVLRAALRKSFRSLVNWGTRNMRLVHVGRANPDAAAFAAYRDFHLAVAGRSTRPEASWTAMRDLIIEGGGELTLGYLEGGELVAGTMVVDGTEVAYYASGVYDRQRFDKPMAHYPLYQAILRAGERGMRVFDLGDVPQAGTVSPKEAAIGYFKRGFAGELAASIVWQWRKGAEDEMDPPS